MEFVKKVIQNKTVQYGFVVTSLGVLAFWQYKRRDWRLGILGRRSAAMSQPAVPILSLLQEMESEQCGYRRVVAEGTFDYGAELRVGPRGPPVSEGYSVLTPFYIKNGPMIFVNRGWMPAANVKDFIPELNQVVTLDGVLRPPVQITPYTWHYFRAGNNNMFRYLDLDLMTEHVFLGSSSPKSSNSNSASTPSPSSTPSTSRASTLSTSPVSTPSTSSESALSTSPSTSLLPVSKISRNFYIDVFEPPSPNPLLIRSIPMDMEKLPVMPERHHFYFLFWSAVTVAATAAFARKRFNRSALGLKK